MFIPIERKEEEDEKEKKPAKKYFIEFGGSVSPFYLSLYLISHV